MGDRVEAEFQGVPESVRAARAFVASAVSTWSLDGVGDVAVLLASEVVTNAVRHARTPYRLSVEFVPPELMIAVVDGSDQLPEPGPAGPDAEDGRGLFLLDQLAQRWGARVQESGGKILWFTLDCPESDPSLGSSR